MRPTMSQHLINKEPDPKQIKLVDQTEEATAPDKEAINPDQDKEEITEPETTATRTASTATSAKLKGTDRRSVEKE